MNIDTMHQKTKTLKKKKIKTVKNEVMDPVI